MPGCQRTHHPETATVTQKRCSATAGQPWILEVGNLVQEVQIRALCIFNCEVKEPQFLQSSLFKAAQRWQVTCLGQASNGGERKPGKRLPRVWRRRGASARQSPLPRDVRPADGAASRREGLPEGPPTPLLVTPLRSLPGCTLASGLVTGRVDRAGRPARHVLAGLECSLCITKGF